jgi:hypothetical protein
MARHSVRAYLEAAGMTAGVLRHSCSFSLTFFPIIEIAATRSRKSASFIRPMSSVVFAVFHFASTLTASALKADRCFWCTSCFRTWTAASQDCQTPQRVDQGLNPVG